MSTSLSLSPPFTLPSVNKCPPGVLSSLACVSRLRLRGTNMCGWINDAGQNCKYGLLPRLMSWSGSWTWSWFQPGGGVGLGCWWSYPEDSPRLRLCSLCCGDASWSLLSVCNVAASMPMLAYRLIPLCVCVGGCLTLICVFSTVCVWSNHKCVHSQPCAPILITIQSFPPAFYRTASRPRLLVFAL